MSSTPPGTEPGSAYTASPPPRPPGRPPFRFVRRERGKLLAGVTTGMADAFHIDVMVVRVIWVVVTIASFGLGVAAYAICWAAFPSELNPAPISQIHRVRHRSSGYIVGVVLVGIGAAIVFGEVVSMRPFRHFGALAWAVVLIGGGLAILFLRHTDDEDDFDAPAPTPPLAATDAPVAADVPGATDTDATDTESADPAAATATEPPPIPIWPPTPPLPPTTSAWTQTSPWPVGPPPRVRRARRRPFLTPITISVLLIGAGIVTLLNNAGTTYVTLSEALAAAAGVIGIVLLLSTRYGRAHGLIPIGILLLLAAIPATLIDVPITGGIGEHKYRPVERSEIQRTYRLGIGHEVVDLTAAPVANRVTNVDGRLGIGEMEVDVPSTVRVVVHAHAGVGSVRLYGQQFDNNTSPDVRETVPGTSRGTLYLNLRVGAGDIHVRRIGPNGFETFPVGVNG